MFLHTLLEVLDPKQVHFSQRSNRHFEENILECCYKKGTDHSIWKQKNIPFTGYVCKILQLIFQVFPVSIL